MQKKIISIFLALVMLVSMIPVSYAAGSDVGITWGLTGIRVPEQKSVLAGEDLDITLEAEEGFALPDDVEIEGIEEDAYFFSSTSGRLFISADAILGDLTVKAEAVAIQAPESTEPEGENSEGNAEADSEDEDCECASSQNLINSAESDISALIFKNCEKFCFFS